MIATNKRNSSHTWKAIIYGREALNLRLIKRIGDGASTSIWEDSWIPSDPRMKPIVRRPKLDVTLVKEPLDPVTGEWNEEIMTTKMVSIDSEAVMRIPVWRLEEDTWACQLERHGNFTVRSAYRDLLQANSTIEPVMWSDGFEQSYWKKSGS